MNQPIKGDASRRGGYAQMMFKPSAQDNPNMTIKVQQGSYWAGPDFVEFAGGATPQITAPLSGAKWVLVGVNQLGQLVIINGAAMPSSPPMPKITAQILPVATVFVRADTRAITNDMIFDVRPLYGALWVKPQHNQLMGRDGHDAHDIGAITGLQQALDDKITYTMLHNGLDSKADCGGTPATTFVLNQDYVGSPAENCGISVCRGSQLSAGLRYNEAYKAWELTNDGTNWLPILTGINTYDYADAGHTGLVQLSVDPIDAKQPIAVGDNDPRIAAIQDKVSKHDLEAYVTQQNMQTALQDVAKADEVYSKTEADAKFVPLASYDASRGYTRDEINRILALKANANGVYSKTEIDEKLSQIYTKTEINELLRILGFGNQHSDNSTSQQLPPVSTSAGGTNVNNMLNYYTKAEVDAIVSHISAQTYTSQVIDNKIAALQHNIDAKANIADVYTKAEIDDKLKNNIKVVEDTTGGKKVEINLSDYYTKTEEDIKFAGKANVVHGHVATDIVEDANHRYITDAERTAWNAKAENLGYVPENIAHKGVANGYASLDADGRLPISQMPIINGIGNGRPPQFVDTYADLNKIQHPANGDIVFVRSAVGDPTVKSGWAQYIYDGVHSTWIKTAESESMDIILDWSNITNKPTVYNPDLSKLTNYATIGSAGNTYIKSEVNNLLEGKSSVNHNHDGRYVKPQQMTDQLTRKVDTDDKRLHNPNVLGSHVVDESNMADGQILTYDARSNKLVYRNVPKEVIHVSQGSTPNMPAGNVGSGMPSGNLAGDDAYQLGSIRVVEPHHMEDGMVLVYDGSVAHDTYKHISDFYQRVGTHLVDESNFGAGKVLTAIDNKLGYTALPANWLDIDNSGARPGRVLALNGTGTKLEYVDIIADTKDGKPTVSADCTTETIASPTGQKMIVSADRTGAVTYTVYQGVSATINIDARARVKTVQFDMPSGETTTLQVNLHYSDNRTSDLRAYEGFMPRITWTNMDGNNIQKNTGVFFDTPYQFHLTGVTKNSIIRVRIDF